MKRELSCMLILVVVFFSVREGFGAVQVDPPSGSVVANFEDTVNAATLTCNVTDGLGNRGITSWDLGNFRGVSRQGFTINLAPELFLLGGDPIPNSANFTYDNQLTILRLTSELDQVMVFCGLTANEAEFTLRIYRPPSLRDNFMVRILENGRNIPIDLAVDPLPFPLDTISFNWSRDGRPLIAGPTLTYSSVTFSRVVRTDSGTYSVFVANSVDGLQVGNDTGSFTLDVIYGPSFRIPAPTQCYALLNSSLSLVCGTGLDSNPEANVTWTAPDGTTIMDNARYDLENGPEIVRLNFTHTILSDNGIWRCEVIVESELYGVSNGKLSPFDSSIIGEPLEIDIQLTLIAAPGQPRTLSVDMVQATLLRVCWEAPFEADSPISYYLVNATNLNSTGGMDAFAVANTTNTFVNITGLLPGTTYELTVVAVSQGGDVVAKSEASDPVIRTTDNTVPALMCGDPVFHDGGITSTWSYIHTGGLSLNRVSVSYTFEEGSTTSSPNPFMTFTSTQPTEVSVPKLVAGQRYIFIITAENDVGSSYIMCGPTLLRVGIPAEPEFVLLTPGSNAGEVTIQIKTVASGVDSTSPQFQFNIVPVLDGVEGEMRERVRNDYVSGTLETITITNLEPGQSYTFSATATNSFGTSETANSESVTAAGARPPTPPQTAGDSSAGLVGGVVGGILAVVVVVTAVIVVVVLLLFLRGRRDYHPKKIEGEYHLAPSSDPTVKVEEVPAVDIGEEKTKPDTENEIQYAELDTIRQPSRPKNDTDEPKPVQPEEPVEYAVITSFKKVDDPAASSVPAPTSPSADDNADSDKAGTSTTLV